MAVSDNLEGLKNVETGGSYGLYVNLEGTKNTQLLLGEIDVELDGLISVEISGTKQDTIHLSGQSYYVNLLGSMGQTVLIRASSNFIFASDDFVKASDGYE